MGVDVVVSDLVVVLAVFVFVVVSRRVIVVRRYSCCSMWLHFAFMMLNAFVTLANHQFE